MNKFKNSLVVLALLIALGQCVFIRKQTIKNDEVLGEIIVIEEYQTVDGNNIDFIIEENAALIEEELDYASQLANYMLNSLEDELLEDQMIEQSGTVFNALESLKGVVDSMQKAEHQYLDEVQHQKEEKEKRLIELEQQVEEEIQIVENVQFKDDANLNASDKEKTVDESTTYSSSQDNTQKSKSRKKQTTTTFNFDSTVEQLDSKLPEPIDEILLLNSDAEVISNEKQWIINDDEDDEEEKEGKQTTETQTENENEKENVQTTNFNQTPEKPKEKVQMKVPNMGLGPQKSMKQLNTATSNTYIPLYQDPSIIIGVISLFAVLGCVLYYFIRSKMNLRKSTSSILEQKNEIYLTPSLKNRGGDAQPLYEKVKLI